MSTPIDLLSCASEPIHIPGAIQPHGLFLALREPELRVVQASANAGDLVGMDATRLLGTDVGGLLDPQGLAELRKALTLEDVRVANPLRFRSTSGGRVTELDGIVHRSQGLLILELEPATDGGASFTAFYHTVRRAIFRLQSAQSFTDATTEAAREVATMTGFGRVMIYQFDSEWNGNVVAEALAPGFDSYLGLRFPASDIPAQARALYTKNWLRLIADTAYTPAPLVPPLHPLTGESLDMSASTLRSVSPVHIEYLKNMDVGASMSISIMKDARLWGLIACHHDTARHVSYRTRSACEFLGQMLSDQLTAIEARQNSARRQEFREKRKEFEQAVVTSPTLADLLGASGALLLLRGKLVTIGAVPDPADLERLVTWLRAQPASGAIVTDHLAAAFPDAAPFADRAAGLLAMPLSADRESWLAWLRPEVVRTVRWAGDPTKPMRQSQGTLRLHPRKSFELWKEDLKLRSDPWSDADLEAATDLRDTILREELARLNVDLTHANAELEKSNKELDSFAFIASHDLKEPLRGIRNYSTFVVEDDGDKLGEGSRAKLAAIVDLSTRMDELLSSLYHYARVGRVGLAVEPTDLGEVVASAVNRLELLLAERHATVRVAGRLPTVRCDPLRTGELFFNLIANGAKYSERELKTIEIGALPATSGPPVIYVKDDGIGIAEKHRETVFQMFKRLHAKDAFGGGTGTGLAIVRRVVEMHGGRVWIESEPGKGTTFFFTLGSGCDA